MARRTDGRPSHGPESGFEFADLLLNFYPDIEAAYESHTRAERLAHLRRTILFGLFFYNAYNFSDFFLVHDIYFLTTIWRLIVVTPMSLLLVWILPRVTAKWRERLIFLGMINAVALPVFGILASRDALSAYTFYEVPLMLVFGNLMLKLRFPHAALFTAITLFVSVLVLAFRPGFGPVLVAALALQITTATFFILYGGYINERSLRKAYLSTCREKARSETSEIARAAAEAGGRAKSEFLANMSHEIRTPLNGLLTMAEVMDRYDLEPDQRSRLTIVRQSGLDLLRLLNDILDFSKIEAGKLDIEAIEFEPEKVLEATWAGFVPVAKEKGLSLRLDMEACIRGGLRRGDPTRLRQIAANFISNAIKFTPSGEVSVHLAGLGSGGHDGLRLCVRDTGIGIAPDKMERLFQKFSQVDPSTTRRFGGTGLGLAICQKLAELMGGRVWAESQEGVGSAFYAELMLPSIADRDASRAAEPERALATRVNPIRVLAAEDHRTNQIVLSTIMELFGFDLSLVEDGAQALQRWRNEDFDVILMDIQMPVMSGVEATRAIRAEERLSARPRTPIIALSANAYSHEIAECVAAGMDAHVSKPIELDALKAALERVLRSTDEDILDAETRISAGLG